MKMTFDEYIANPMGKKNAVYGNREMFKELYKKKLDAILVREIGKVKYKLYQSKDRYYIYFKIPSETIEKFYYDTVIEFYTDDTSVQLSGTLNKYYVKFYSNDPSFVFTFAHAMKANDMFIKDLEPKMSREALKKVGKEKNPKDEIGYVKSIFFAYLLMKQYGLFAKVQFKSYGEKYNKKILQSEIMDAEDKVNERIEKAEDIAKQKRIEKNKKKTQKEEKLNNERKNNPININSIRNTKKIDNVKRTSKAQSHVKRSKKTKHI